MKPHLLLCLLLVGCATVKPDGTRTEVDHKAVVAVTKSLAEFSLDLAYRRYLEPAETQTLYHNGRVVRSQVPRP